MTKVVGEALGQGYSGASVVRGRNLSDGTPVAVKVLQVKESVDMDQIQEIIAHKHFQHFPGCVKLYGCHRDAENVNISMELIDGMTIDQFHTYLRTKTLTDPQKEQIIRSLLVQGAETLAHIHGTNWTHNDIKNENMMVTRTPSGKYRLVFIDYEASKPSQNLKSHFTDLWSMVVVLISLARSTANNPRWLEADCRSKGKAPKVIPLCGVDKCRTVPRDEYIRRLRQLLSRRFVDIIESVLCARDPNSLPTAQELYSALTALQLLNISSRSFSFIFLSFICFSLAAIGVHFKLLRM